LLLIVYRIEKEESEGGPFMHDILIRGGKIVDGTGKPAFTGDVAIAMGVSLLWGKTSAVRRRR